jgi:2-keto-3-deoxy-L-rhamnonate aldolase RhmA
MKKSNLDDPAIAEILAVTGYDFVTSVSVATAPPEAMRYPPHGSSGLSVATPAALYGTASVAGHLSAVAQDTLLTGQIESMAGLAALNAINGCGVFGAGPPDRG